MVLPGPEAQQLATYIGWLMHRTWGGIVAGGLFVLPSLFILIALSWVYLAYGDLSIVAGALYGIKPAVTAIVVFAAYRIGSRSLRNGALWAIAVAAFIAIFAFNVPFPLIVLTAGLVGYVGGRFAPARFQMGGGHALSNQKSGASVIDDDTPAPDHARFSWAKVGAVCLVALVLWGAGIGALVITYGWTSTFAQLAWFFTKAAFVTFGGAYAVLPYVYQAAVERYTWLTASQMIDGLALGETTPGPLIMVVAFVGFVAGWTKEVFGTDALFAAGAAGAVVATFFTFLPSFIFILVGGPLVETTHGDVKFTAPLTSITAAVVGVILNLAVFFAYHVLWPEGFDGQLEWASAIIGAAACVALWGYRLGIIPVIAGCGAAGLLVSLWLR
jgi:chromate transporter